MKFSRDSHAVSPIPNPVSDDEPKSVNFKGSFDEGEVDGCRFL